MERFQGFDLRVEKDRVPRDFEEAILLKKKEGLNPVIAEVKPASPRGKIREITRVGEVVKAMIKGGCCGISVLTEEKFFFGSLNNLREASAVSDLPVLRKDFIFHPDQIKEAYYYGADSVLLIAALLSNDDLEILVSEAREYGMEPVIEVHSEEDVEKAAEVKARLVLINNRDKDTLEVDLERSRNLAGVIEDHRVKISASGISTPEELHYVLECCDAALVGTAIMRAENIRNKVEELVCQLPPYK